MSICLRRREFVTLLGGAAAWPLAARAQQRTLRVIGILGSTTAEVGASRVNAFMQGLKDTGFVEGQNMAIVAHWTNDQYDRLLAMVLELVRAPVGLIFATDNMTARVVASATRTIPTVFATGGDTVQLHITGPVEFAQDALRSWGGRIEIAQARTVGDFDAAFASLAERQTMRSPHNQTRCSGPARNDLLRSPRAMRYP